MTFYDFPTCSLNGPVTPPAVALAAVPGARPEAALVAAPEICWVPWLRYPGTKWRGVLELSQISECFSLEGFSKVIHVYKQQRLRGQQCQHMSTHLWFFSIRIHARLVLFHAVLHPAHLLTSGRKLP